MTRSLVPGFERFPYRGGGLVGVNFKLNYGDG